MARGDSSIRVLILGDSKGLKSELGEAERGLKGFSVSAKAIVGGIAATVVADQLVSFGKTALAEADRLGDATTRLELQLGDLSAELVRSADEFAHLGQSAQDVLELEAAFTDVATALGVADPLIASMADEAAATAAAVALLGETDAATVIDQIGKAAGGSEKALKALGINLSDAEIEARALADTGKANADNLTDAEKAAAAYALVLEKLAPKLDAVTEAGGDFESKTAEIDAKLETLTGKIGAHLEGPLTGLLDWMISGIEGWEMFADRMDEIPAIMRAQLGPIYAVTDALSALAGLLGDVGRGLAGDPFNENDLPGGNSHPGGAGWRPGMTSAGVTVNVNGGDPAEVERAVQKAVGGYQDRNGKLMWDP